MGHEQDTLCACGHNRDIHHYGVHSCRGCTCESFSCVNRPCKETDPVNRPSHYTFAPGYEVIDVLEAWQLPFHLANAVKYIARAGKKDPSKTVEDLRKSVWYLERYIWLLEKNNG